MDKNNQAWLIWSHEHGSWWRPGRMGYTYNVDGAGRYTLDEAIEICSDANIYLRPGGPPKEIMTPAPEAFPGYKLTGEKLKEAGQ